MAADKFREKNSTESESAAPALSVFFRESSFLYMTDLSTYLLLAVEVLNCICAWWHKILILISMFLALQFALKFVFPERRNIIHYKSARVSPHWLHRLAEPGSMVHINFANKTYINRLIAKQCKLELIFRMLDFHFRILLNSNIEVRQWQTQNFDRHVLSHWDIES